MLEVDACSSRCCCCCCPVSSLPADCSALFIDCSVLFIDYSVLWVAPPEPAVNWSRLRRRTSAASCPGGWVVWRVGIGRGTHVKRGVTHPDFPLSHWSCAGNSVIQDATIDQQSNVFFFFSLSLSFDSRLCQVFVCVCNTCWVLFFRGRWCQIDVAGSSHKKNNCYPWLLERVVTFRKRQIITEKVLGRKLKNIHFEECSHGYESVREMEREKDRKRMAWRPKSTMSAVTAMITGKSQIYHEQFDKETGHFTFRKCTRQQVNCQKKKKKFRKILQHVLVSLIFLVLKDASVCLSVFLTAQVRQQYTGESLMQRVCEGGTSES